MTTCPCCGARSTPPTPVPGEPNTTESWIRHTTGCDRFAPAPESAGLLAAVTPAEWDAATYAVARIEAKPYGPKPAKQNGTTR